MLKEAASSQLSVSDYQGIGVRERDMLRGVLPVFQVPYDDDETIDRDTLQREIDWLFSCGVNGVTMAMVSEVLRLSSEERRQVTEWVCEWTRQRGPVIISVGAESTKLAESFARHAEQCGASAVMAIPPLAVELSAEELAKYYTRILRAVTIPVILQDASSYLGRSLPVEAQVRLFEESGGRVLFKPEAKPVGSMISQLRAATLGRAEIFDGSAGVSLVDNYRRGVVGTMPGADLAKVIVSLWRALEVDDQPRIAKLAERVTALASLQTSLDAYLAVEKYLLMKQGVFRNAIVRGPVGWVFDEATRREVDRLFDELINAI